MNGFISIMTNSLADDMSETVARQRLNHLQLSSLENRSQINRAYPVPFNLLQKIFEYKVWPFDLDNNKYQYLQDKVEENNKDQAVKLDPELEEVFKIYENIYAPNTDNNNHQKKIEKCLDQML